MKRTLIHNATIVNEGQSVKGSVVIEDGRIAEVLTNWKPLSAPCDETIDATGCYLLPGIYGLVTRGGERRSEEHTSDLQ